MNKYGWCVKFPHILNDLIVQKKTENMKYVLVAFWETSTRTLLTVANREEKGQSIVTNVQKEGEKKRHIENLCSCLYPFVRDFHWSQDSLRLCPFLATEIIVT